MNQNLLSQFEHIFSLKIPAHNWKVVNFA